MINSDNVLNNIETVTITGPLGSQQVEAKIDTGAYRSSFDTQIAVRLGLFTLEKVLEYKKISNSLGESTRPIVAAELAIRSKRMTTEIGVIDRTNLRYRAIIGRKDLSGFLVQPDPELTH